MSQYDTVDWKALLGHRILLRFSKIVYEAIVREVSPACDYLRVEYLHSHDAFDKDQWLPISIIDDVQDLTNNPRWEEKGARNDVCR